MLVKKILIKFAAYFSEMNKEIIAIIGGPGTGKSTIIEALKKKGYCCYPEISREIILEARKKGHDQLFLEKPLLFSEMLLEGRIKQFQNALKEKTNTIFIDRGIPDILAYMNYIKSPYPTSFDQACKDHKYTKIFVLPPWKEIHTTDEARYENYEQACLLYEHLRSTYQSYGYNLIEVPKDTINNRIIYILEHIS